MKRLNYRGNYRGGKERYRLSQHASTTPTCSNEFHIRRSITVTLLPSFTRLTARPALLNDPCNGWSSRAVYRGRVREKKYFLFSF